jgi:hypothetical protein
MDDALEVGVEEGSALADSPVFEETTAPFVGRWNRLVSHTNWEKGRIISIWRAALTDAGAADEATDEAWATRVGGVTPQHVGRLRRVWDRFGEVYKQYAGLFWSHFQSAVDWDDAEMWLEGAAQSRWSISEMRARRGEAMGVPADVHAREEDVQPTDYDEDAETTEHAAPSNDGGANREFGDEEDDYDAPFDDEPAASGAPVSAVADAMTAPPVRPFEHLPTLPADITEAFEAFKLAIIGRRVSGWQDVACDDVLAALDALKQLAVAPTE